MKGYKEQQCHLKGARGVGVDEMRKRWCLLEVRMMEFEVNSPSPSPSPSLCRFFFGGGDGD